MDWFKNFSGFFLDIIEIVVVALSIIMVVYLFFVQPHQVDGRSMFPNFHDKDFLLTDKVSYRTGRPQRGDVVVFHAPEAAGCIEGTGCDFIKRVIALPGEQVAVHDNAIWINGQALPEPYIPEENYTKEGEYTRGGRTIILGPDEYFVVGDNRPHSSDSRVFGPIRQQDIVGRAFFRYWPLNSVGVVPKVSYAGFNLNSGTFATN